MALRKILALIDPTSDIQPAFERALDSALDTGAALHLFATTSMGIFLATVTRSMPQFALLLILVLLHATDLPLYDGRVNVAGWILLAGLRAACWPQGFRPQQLR